MRLQDVKHVFESQKNFSEQPLVAKRIRSALDFLAAAIPSKSKSFRNRSITQSFITMVCHLQKSNNLKGREAKILAFAKDFVDGLAAEVEKGQDATDSEYIAFHRSVNANVKTGPVVRHRVLLRKLFQFDPDVIYLVDTDISASADYSGEVSLLEKLIRADIANINAAYSAKNGVDLFKSTNKTVQSQAEIGELVESFEDYKSLIESMYFLFWEGPGAKLADKPSSFKDVNVLRTELEHDTDHGDAKSVAKKKVKHGEVFKKYAGLTSPAVASPARFPLLQLGLLKAIRSDLQLLLAAMA